MEQSNDSSDDALIMCPLYWASHCIVQREHYI